MRTSLLVLASVLTATTAHAEKVGIVVTGEASLQPQLKAQLERWLHDRGRTIVPGALEPDAVGTLIDCFVLEDLSCARGVVDTRASSRSLIFARVEQTSNDDGTRDISVTGYWFQKERDVTAERRVCERCTDPKLFATVDDLLLALVHAPPPPPPGATPAATATSTAALETAPATSESDGAQDERSQARVLLPYGLMGAGALGVIGGLVMIAVDEDPDPVGVQSPRYRDTATAGTVLAIGGAAAVGVGLYLWLTDKPSSHPVAAVSHDGAVVGWTGRF